MDTRKQSEADTLFDSANNKLYVLSHIKDTDTAETDLGIKFQRFGFNATSKTYTLEASKSIVRQAGRDGGPGQGQHRKALGHLHRHHREWAQRLRHPLHDQRHHLR